MQNKFVIIMGVAGSGKTTIGKLLSEKTGWPFYDADSFHPQQNIDKMKAGVPLTDEDRKPWLATMNEFASKKIKNSSIILACSALKEIYRLHLCKGIETNSYFVFLKGSYEIILQRMKQREGHYMPSSLLQSQFEALEEPAAAIAIDIALPPQAIVEKIINAITK